MRQGSCPTRTGAQSVGYEGQKERKEGRKRKEQEEERQLHPSVLGQFYCLQAEEHRQRRPRKEGI